MKRILYLVCVALVLLTGCVRVSLENKEHEPALMAAEGGDGQVTLMWESDTRYIYTVFYMEQGEAKWLPLRNANRIKGTGKKLNVKDRVNPKDPPRRYRLAFEKKQY